MTKPDPTKQYQPLATIQIGTLRNLTNPCDRTGRDSTRPHLATNPNFTRLALATKRKKLTINSKETTMSAPTTVPAIYQGNHLNYMKQALINAHLMKDDGSIERAIRVTAATQKAFVSMLSLIGGEGETSEERDALRSALESPITRATIEERKFFFLQE